MKWYKSIISFMIVFTLIFSISLINAHAEMPFSINAKSAILIDQSTGKILYEKNIHEALPPASVTKIMTMLLAMEALDSNRITLDDKVVISEYASSMGGTQLYLEPGEIKTVEELMKGLVIRSANDAAVAIGEYIAGTEEMFVQKMNERAKELGMEDTNFVNSNGLPAEGHVTSAYDVAQMSRELLKHDGVKGWLTTWMDTVVVGKNQSEQQLVNTNRLIRFYDGATGVKTGYTNDAKHCLSASATRGNNSFIAVVLAAPSSQIRFDEASKLLDYGFANFNTVEIVKKSASVGKIQVQKGKEVEIDGVALDDLKVLVNKGDEGKVKKEVIIPQYIQAPMEKGEKIGEVIVTIDGTEVNRVDIVTPEEIEKASILDILSRMFKRFAGN
ncbi:D-alanyl-D-alanine carboxypeptidase family protein [Alkaliphilus peptidifermentans]|uniref:serine-type D-Ala-D-Ala carboxypeptidase n=1 Tax=Alkaliphilus peptidifermentans DSM 18978 TaxID=1120976 RepID=A0A1G5KEH8_9FIRM|nr:D-alanyl-D-alanine carboxypeptidase family protein [Alkaliphilus peptidifermentans]SCY99035.1 D-alanyl-D-alanine carboxypeptidase (penicillin-binding protein 5/6) [Alkaliphilus peptidifermentans DSM 18978]